MDAQQRFDECLREALCVVGCGSVLILVAPDLDIVKPASRCLEVDGHYIYIRVCHPGMSLKSVVVFNVFVVGDCDKVEVYWAKVRIPQHG